MILELLAVGDRGKFKGRFSPLLLRKVCDAYRDSAIMAAPRRKIRSGIDKKDDIFLECAVEAGADYVISGDRHLTAIGNFEGILIVTPADFLRITR